MSIYGGQLSTVNEASILTESDMQDICNALENIDFSDYLEESVYDIIEEGYNIDITKSFVSNQKIIKKCLKDAKKDIKDGNKDSAKKKLSEASKATAEIRKSIEKAEGGVGSAFLGFFASGLLNIYRNLFGICASFTIGISTKIVGSKLKMAVNMLDIAGATKYLKPLLVLKDISIPVGIYNFIKCAIIFIKDICTFIERIQKGDKTSDILNLYRNDMISMLKDLEKSIDKLSKEIK